MPNARTREQDALSLFDEGGLLIGAPRELDVELEGADDGALGAQLARGAIAVVPFGHALYEHMVAGAPCPLATAYVVRAPARSLLHSRAEEPRAWTRELDAALAVALSAPTAFAEPSPARGISLRALDDIARARISPAARSASGSITP